MIAANKIDLASDRQVDAEKGLSFAEEQLGDKTAYMETSGKNSGKPKPKSQHAFQPKMIQMWITCFRLWLNELIDI